MGVQIPHGKGQFLGKGTYIVNKGGVQKPLNRSICRLGLGGPKEAHVQSYSPGGANVPDDTFHDLCNKSLAVAEMVDRGNNRHEPKSGGAGPF